MSLDTPLCQLTVEIMIQIKVKMKRNITSGRQYTLQIARFSQRDDHSHNWAKVKTASGKRFNFYHKTWKQKVWCARKKWRTQIQNCCFWPKSLTLRVLSTSILSDENAKGYAVAKTHFLCTRYLQFCEKEMWHTCRRRITNKCNWNNWLCHTWLSAFFVAQQLYHSQQYKTFMTDANRETSRAKLSLCGDRSLKLRNQTRITDSQHSLNACHLQGVIFPTRNDASHFDGSDTSVW